MRSHSTIHNNTCYSVTIDSVSQIHKGKATQNTSRPKTTNAIQRSPQDVLKARENLALKRPLQKALEMCVFAIVFLIGNFKRTASFWHDFNPPKYYRIITANTLVTKNVYDSYGVYFPLLKQRNIHRGNKQSITAGNTTWINRIHSNVIFDTELSQFFLFSAHALIVRHTRTLRYTVISLHVGKSDTERWCPVSRSV